MTLYDEVFSRLIELYQDLDDQQIHNLNARIIILLLEKISDPVITSKVLNQVEAEKKTGKNS